MENYFFFQVIFFSAEKIITTCTLEPKVRTGKHLF